MDQVKVSFIVITYRRGELLTACLRSIAAQQGLAWPCEMIVVDNAGDTHIELPPMTSYITCRIERLAENHGVCGGRNYGMQQARGEYWIFIDDDAQWQRSDSVSQLIAYLDSHPQVGCLALKSLHPDGTPVIAEYPYPNKPYAASLQQPTDAPYFVGVGHVLRASAMHHTRVGFYPERYFYGMEEYDLSLRLYDAGYRVVFMPEHGVYHFKSDLGRPVVGAGYWHRMALNKMRAAWRLLPQPYPLTIMSIWGFLALKQTKSLLLPLKIWRNVWQERAMLRQERNPIQANTVRRLRQAGARLLY